MRRYLLASAALALSFSHFAIAPAQAQQAAAAPASISAKDKQIGAKAHPDILNEFGGLYEGPQAAYVTKVGRKIAVQSGLSNAQGDFTISLLNSSVNNAFAIPGGYVYVTRELLGLMNNEAELASVLGHETGHVAARHSDKRQKKATIGGLGALAATILGAAVLGDQGAKLGQQLGGTLAQRWVLGYSRAQEFEADDLGVSYLAKAGYDPIASSTMLASLAAQTELDTRRAGTSQKSLPAWASTHPDPGSRVLRAAQKAAATGSTSRVVNRDDFLTAINGMLYEDDPKQGVIDGQSFRHPELKLAFDAPTGYTLSNGAAAVTVSGSGGQAQFSGGAYSGDLNAYVGSVFKALGGQNVTLDYGTVSRTTINGLNVGYASAQTNTQSGPVTVTVYAYEFGPTSAFHVLGIYPQGSGNGPFTSLFQSVRRLSAQEIAAIRPRRIEVLTVRSGDTVQSMAGKMAYTDFQADRFRVLNGLKAADTIKSGQKVKIIVYGK
jgi:predicted Zn-dependent protease